MQRSAGSTFAGYRLDAMAGRGGMGIVYKATELALGRTVALKLIAPDLAHEPSYRERFERELRAVASLDHPNVIPVYHAGEEDGQLYVAMRWVEGTDLHALIAREGRLELARGAWIVSEVSAALDFAHANGLYHRDIKPANVLIGSGGQERVFLSDFGLAKRSTSAGGLTAAGQWVGTPDYVSPEQIRGVSLDARGDVYSLGCVLFHAVTGEPPFPIEGDAGKLWAHMTDPPPSARERIPSLPEALDEVLKHAMAKDRDERYASAGELGRAALEAIQSQAVDQGGATELAGEPDWAAAGRTELGSSAPAGDAGGTELGSSAPGGRTELGSQPPGTGAVAEPGGGSPSPRSAPAPVAGHLQAPQAARRPRAVWLAAAAAFVLVVVGVAAALLLGGGEESADQRGSPTTPIPVGDNPTDIDVGEGAVWVANYGSGTVTRIDPATNRPAGRPIPVGDVPQGVAVGEGGVWISNAFGRLTRVEPRSDEVGDDPIALGTDPYAVAAGAGSVWVANGLERSVTRVDPEFNRIEDQSIRVGSTPASLDVGEGSVWVANRDGASVTRIDVESGEVTDASIEVGRTPSGVAVGAGFVWVANSEDDSVTRIDAKSGKVRGEAIRVGRAPSDVAVAGRSVWVTNAEDDSVTRIDAESGEVIGRAIPAGPGPTAVAAGEGAVWVTNSAANRVTRIDP